MRFPRPRRTRPAFAAVVLFLAAMCLPASAAEPPGVLFRPARLDWYRAISGGFDLGDMDGDGVRDMVAPRGDKVTVFLGRADGTFEPHFESEYMLAPKEVRLADFDGDGALDAAVATGYRLFLLFGDGNGALGSPVEHDPGNNEDTLALADFDGDGDIDVAITGYDIAVYRNNGDGTMSGPDLYAAGLYPRDVESADVSQDGRPDLVVASQDNAVQVLLNAGDGTFLPAVAHAAGAVPNSVRVADLNGDAFPDIVTANFHGEGVSVLFGAGGGAFQPQLAIPLGNQALYVEVGDIDEDGAQDLFAMCRMTYSNSGGIWMIAGDGAGQFAPPVLVPTQYDGYAARVTDVDGDGFTDLLVGKSYLSLFRGNGTRDLGAPRYPTVGEPLDMACDRFDADAVPDLVVLTDGGPEFLRGLGDGSFAPAAPAGPSTAPAALAHGDFDGNGTMDLAVVEDGPNQAGIWLNDGNGVFTRHAGFGAGQNPRQIEAGDLDGDGRPDLVIANQVNVALLFGLEGGDFAGPTILPVGQLEWIELADADGDGALDLLSIPVGYNAAPLDVRYGAGDGTFPRKGSYPMPTRTWSAAVADLDGDGRLDIAAPGSARLCVLWGEGGRGFEVEEYSAAPNANWLALSSVAIGDVNGDGRLDVLTVRRFQLERVNVFLGAGPHEPARALRMADLGYGAGHYPRALTLRDLDGDGDLDVATANGGTHDVSVLPGAVTRDALADEALQSLHPSRDATPVAADDGVIRLGRPFPSPFRSGTSVPFVLPSGGRARIGIFDVQGRLVRVLTDGARTAGRHEAVWDGRDERSRVVPAGVYFVRLEAEAARATTRVLRLR